MSTRSLAEMFNRLLQAEGQTRAARSVEYFGWIDFVNAESAVNVPADYP